jgi:hypothetical protein
MTFLAQTIPAGVAPSFLSVSIMGELIHRLHPQMVTSETGPKSTLGVPVV